MHGKNFKGKSLNEIATLMRIGGNSSKNLINIIKGNIQIFSVAFHHYKFLAFIHFSFKPFWKLKRVFLPESADLRKYTGGIEKLNKFFFFLLSCLICTPIFIPNFFFFHLIHNLGTYLFFLERVYFSQKVPKYF